ncbi:MAG: hypothetical protein R3281_06445 [Balneolaceae bacterium]|nr:hypothetical protein [Balneolaceae bacterium]
MSYNQQLEDRIDHYLIDNEELYKNKRLGWVGWLLNGNMCFGIYDDLLIIRLNPSLGSTLVERAGITNFRQADETSGHILAVQPGVYNKGKALQKFIEYSMQFTETLPHKEEDEWTTNLQ